jgi:hypothetical protein
MKMNRAVFGELNMLILGLARKERWEIRKTKAVTVNAETDDAGDKTVDIPAS